MNRFKRHKVKREKPEPSASYSREAEEHDLAYYIHDRVELMHQVFSVLKHKELRTMAPECVRHISIDDLQELCTEELLGISSKRLCAILDGAEPPSDTESSSQSEPERLETISLDSISSDEEILSQTSSKRKKHKHRRRDSKTKTKKKRTKSKEPEAAEDAEKSKASRAGLTVLELLELQARARAIRAQLQQEQTIKQSAQPTPAADQESNASENEVEIKEEPPEVVEISSDEEKPKIEELQKELPKAHDDGNKNGIEVETTNRTSEKGKEANKSKDKKNKKDKNKKVKRKAKENKRKDSEKNNKKDSQKDKKDLERDNSRTDIESAKKESPELSKEVDNTQKVTKKINDLIITVPQQHSRKIKLNRNKVTVSVASVESSNRTVSVMSPVNEVIKPTESTVKSTVHVANKSKEKLKSKKKHKKKERKNSSDKDASDHDEITLQLSDSEKMDLLEDFDRRNLDNVTSSSEDSDSSSESDSDSSQDTSKEATIDISHSVPVEEVDDNSRNNNEDEHGLKKNIDNKVIDLEDEKDITQDTEKSTSKEVSLHIEDSNTRANNDEKCKNDNTLEKHDDEKCKNDNTLEKQNEIQQDISNDLHMVNDDNTTASDKTDILNKVEGFISSNDTENNLVINNVNDIPVREDIQESQVNYTDNQMPKMIEIDKITEIAEKTPENETTVKSAESDTKNIHNESTVCTDQIENDVESNDTTQDSNKNMSEGEVSSNESSGVEACELKPEVVCISDEESDSNKAPKKKKHKKEKKPKKEKKLKKSKSDFREGADQNFYRDVDIHAENENDREVTLESKEYVSLVDDDDVYEILELSDDSSCYEVEGTVLSKEPTAEEIEALSAKIDEIEREDVITEEQIKEHERELMKKRNTNEDNTENEENREDNIENISWKDRYLGSKKVKTVLTTSNILNALRKKNKELKKKLQESKKTEEQIEEPTEIPVVLEEGSIEHYNTLQGSNKYVDPIPDQVTENIEIAGSTETQGNITDKNNIQIQVTGEMKKDAKQLLKMYKKLLKYNDMTKPKDPNKKKKKKQKKKENDASIVTNSEVVSQ